MTLNRPGMMGKVDIKGEKRVCKSMRLSVPLVNSEKSPIANGNK
jgi:hypothetical protein